MKSRSIWAAAVTIFLMGAFSSQANAANNPINGQYKCKGMSTLTIDIMGVGAGTKKSNVKGTMNARRGSFSIALTTRGWQAKIGGNLAPNAQKLTFSSTNKANKSRAQGCRVGDMWEKGSGSQNQVGNAVDFLIEQSYFCGTTDAEYTNTYKLTCNR
jgi:hypothetical protein